MKKVIKLRRRFCILKAVLLYKLIMFCHLSLVKTKVSNIVIGIGTTTTTNPVKFPHEQGLARVDVRSHTPREAVSVEPSALRASTHAYKHKCTLLTNQTRHSTYSRSHISQARVHASKQYRLR